MFTYFKDCSASVTERKTPSDLYTYLLPFKIDAAMQIPIIEGDVSLPARRPAIRNNPLRSVADSVSDSREKQLMTTLFYALSLNSVESSDSCSDSTHGGPPMDKSRLIVPVLLRGQELCKSRGGPPGLPVPNSHYGHGGRKALLNERSAITSQQLFSRTLSL